MIEIGPHLRDVLYLLVVAGVLLALIRLLTGRM